MTTKQQLIEKWEEVLERYSKYSEAPTDEVAAFIQDLKALDEVNEGQIDELKRDYETALKIIDGLTDKIQHLTSKPKEEVECIFAFHKGGPKRGDTITIRGYTFTYLD